MTSSAAEPEPVGWHIYAGVAAISLANLLFELLLTRIFSVTMWYHFAFMAVSVAMFGMTAGSLIVFLKPKLFSIERTQEHLIKSSFTFAISIVACFWLQTFIPTSSNASATSLAWLGLIYAITAVPFFFSGVGICLALTRFPRAVSQIYACDLIGAAAGCLLLQPLLVRLGGPTAVLAVSAIAAFGGLLFCWTSADRSLFKKAFLLTLALAMLSPLNSQFHIIRLNWLKGQAEVGLRHEKWNTFSRVRVFDYTNRPFGWALSDAVPKDSRISQLGLDIDSNALTVITAFDGDTTKLNHLKFDVTNLAHYLRSKANVLVVGVGGGRDILSALTFEQNHVLGVELNDNILGLLRNECADFSGHLSSHPRVTLVNDEARSFVARQKQSFDIIQISLIDTWAATSAGAYVLSENSLYTKEAWKTFLDHLNPDGILSCSRWYHKGQPAELYRLLALAVETLHERGIHDARGHLLLALSKVSDEAAVGTLLVSPNEFSSADVLKLEHTANKMGWTVMLSPDKHDTPDIDRLTSPESSTFVRDYPQNISPPTDDSPFFFQLGKLNDWNGLVNLVCGRAHADHALAVSTLIALSVVVTVLSSVCIVLPLAISKGKLDLKHCSSHLLFFISIGCGFMFIEISQLQQLTVFLGHPSLSLVVVVFTLLLSGGLGSFLSGKLKQSTLVAIMVILCCVVAAGGFLTPLVASWMYQSDTSARIAASIALLVPLGVCMGMPFPSGMNLSSRNLSSFTPWFWGLNGAASVFASVASIVVSLSFGIRAAYWVGLACYAVALAAAFRMQQQLKVGTEESG